MPASPFNAMHATVDPRAVLIRDFLAEAGEEHGRHVMSLAIDRVMIVTEADTAAVVEIINAECLRMATAYAEAGCTRRQVGSFVLAYRRGANARVGEAMALLRADQLGSA